MWGGLALIYFFLQLRDAFVHLAFQGAELGDLPAENAELFSHSSIEAPPQPNGA
jgi:hypothetical protein